MSTAIQYRGGTQAAHQSFTGLERELTVDTTKNTVRVHDGLKLGGYSLLTEALLGENFLLRPDAQKPGFIKPSAQELSVMADVRVPFQGNIFTFENDTPIDMPGTFTQGEDYAVFFDPTGSGLLQAMPDPYHAPATPPTPNAKKIGGFHYSLVSPTETVAGGGFSTSGVTSSGGSMDWDQTDVNRIRGINEFSIWDLSWRCRGEQRGMVYDPIANAWCAIYFMSTDPDTNGISRYNTDVASGTVLPYIPKAWDGDGTIKYNALRFYEAVECVTSLGLRLPTYDEFMSFAFGVTEGQSIGGASSTIPATLREPGYTSRIGIEQATGHAYTFGQPYFSGGSGWSGAGRGSFYASSGLALLSGTRAGAGDSGSRSGIFNLAPSSSSWSHSVRAAGDHVNLVIGAR